MSPARPTLGDVARIAGVHKATASRALNPATVHRVHTETARRVKAAAEQLGYRPNMNARGLRMRNTRTIGVLIPDVLSQLYPLLIRGIDETSREYDHFPLVADSERDPERETRALDNLVSRQVDGLISASSSVSRDALRRIAQGGTPVVVLDNDDNDAEPAEVSVVGLDLEAGVDALTALVVEAGHRCIAVLSPPESDDNPPLRADLHAAALRRMGVDTVDLVRVTAADFSIEAGRAAAAELLATRPDVTAVMAFNDILAIGVIRAARDAGLQLPDDLTVTGFNDGFFADSVIPALTTVRLDMVQLGREAAEVLMRAIATPGRLERRKLPVTLVPRASHGPPRRR